MVLFDSLLTFPIEMSAVIHQDSEIIEGEEDGYWYNMRENALNYNEVDGLEKNLDEMFDDKPEIE